jgi:cytochrome c oxidase cbb3-type subunit 3
MKKIFVLVFSVAAFMTQLTGCIGSNEPVGGKQPQSAAPAGKQDAGEQARYAAGYAIFNRTCRVCHGPAGNGKGSRQGPSLQRTEYTYGRDREAVMASIRNGRPNGMPAFSHVFTPEEIEALTTYLLTLE